ncbi:MFS-type transporter SLC18B1-like [Acanthaster planci]|uniref:MFS-type transporter SLC18B1-like n=1 Tax=Acanthaster planci TaxID=133434 RepID=A0A8B7ZD52_ACAPL|nr:MFS-type transporter SLC18B1-like [Acanthaster planci]XP_022102776.1 MFS-type transporter SLC18B1-like [Acanthaster planci]XP_022102777.1 MFS-type transporter SLC18B1-like [Acanthaster planci]XP_022102779.1 MFS-type transporter SLC18B1-like [Acanthaster planci]XP_022102780.1 MFS-type transporter SLC18B1-like [Acanthaster planci]XP_022102781.1 MFS-type transporter SLC18B1-like [Acanthaster planci]
MDKCNPAPTQEYANSGQQAPTNADLTTPSTNRIDPGRQTGASEANEVDTPPKGPKFTYYQKATFASAVLANLANYMAFSIISVFYPINAEGRGVSQTVIGLVFSAFSLSAGIGSPIWGKTIPIVGARFVFLAGTFVTGCCSILFGSIAAMPTKETFTGFSLAIRLLGGLGSSACLTASAACVAYAFPENVGTAVSTVEMMGGLSCAIGPAIGGLLYDAGGFELPFFVLGAVVLVVNFINFFLLPEQGTKNEESGSLIRVLRIPAMWVALASTALAAVAFSVLNPTLSIHLKRLDFTVIQISLIFFGWGLAYAMATVIWGAVADATKATRIMMVMGAFGTAVFYLLLGPSPLLKIPSTKLVAILAIPFGAAMMALISIPPIVDMFDSAVWYGIPNNLGLSSIISGLWNGGVSVGLFAGPLLGGQLADRYGFAILSTVIAGCCLVVMIFICLFGVWEYQCGKGRRIPSSRLEAEANSTEDERRPLAATE